MKHQVEQIAGLTPEKAAKRKSLSKSKLHSEKSDETEDTVAEQVHPLKLRKTQDANGKLPNNSKSHSTNKTNTSKNNLTIGSNIEDDTETSDSNEEMEHSQLNDSVTIGKQQNKSSSEGVDEARIKNSTLCISDIPPAITVQDMQTFLGRYGKVKHIKSKQFKHNFTKKLSGNMTVRFNNPDEARKALEINGMNFQGGRLQAKISNAVPDCAQGVFVRYSNYIPKFEMWAKLEELCGPVESICDFKTKSHVYFEHVNSVEVAVHLKCIAINEQKVWVSKLKEHHVDDIKKNARKGKEYEMASQTLRRSKNRHSNKKSKQEKAL